VSTARVTTSQAPSSTSLSTERLSTSKIYSTQSFESPYRTSRIIEPSYSQTQRSESHINSSQLTGVVVGSVVGLGFGVAVLVIFICRCLHRRQARTQSTTVEQFDKLLLESLSEPGQARSVHFLDAPTLASRSAEPPDAQPLNDTVATLREQIIGLLDRMQALEGRRPRIQMPSTTQFSEAPPAYRTQPTSLISGLFASRASRTTRHGI
jgi:hypothetical protein